MAESLYQFEGHIVDIDSGQGIVWVRLVDLTEWEKIPPHVHPDYPEEEAGEIEINRFSPADQRLLAPGVCFHWTVGVESGNHQFEVLRR